MFWKLFVLFFFIKMLKYGKIFMKLHNMWDFVSHFEFIENTTYYWYWWGALSFVNIPCMYSFKKKIKAYYWYFISIVYKWGALSFVNISFMYSLLKKFLMWKVYVFQCWICCHGVEMYFEMYLNKLWIDITYSLLVRILFSYYDYFLQKYQDNLD